MNVISFFVLLSVPIVLRPILLFVIQDAILKYDGEHQESIVQTSFEGATRASKGRKLGCKDNRVHFPALAVLFFPKTKSSIVCFISL